VTSQPADQLIIETPELIDLEYPLAGVGSRSLAMLIDTLLQFIAIILLILGTAYLSTVLPPDKSAQASNFDPKGWALAALIFAGYAVYWGYFALFELFWSGQTPGKRYMKLRVLHRSGRPMTAVESVERNFLRVVDYLPSFYLLGAMFAIFSRNKQRLGDLAAGSVVVHEAVAAADCEWYAATRRVDLALGEVSALTPEEFQIMESFLSRRRDLPLQRRNELARRIASLMERRLGLPEKLADDEVLLEEMTRRWRDAASYRMQ